jgi:hypothetical protein
MPVSALDLVLDGFLVFDDLAGFAGIGLAHGVLLPMTAPGV